MRIFKETCQRSYEFHPALEIVVSDDADRKTDKIQQQRPQEAGFHVSALQESTLPTTSKNSISNLNNTNDKSGLYFFPSAPLEEETASQPLRSAAEII